jgi:hypothetical protein
MHTSYCSKHPWECEKLRRPVVRKWTRTKRKRSQFWTWALLVARKTLYKAKGWPQTRKTSGHVEAVCIIASVTVTGNGTWHETACVRRQHSSSVSDHLTIPTPIQVSRVRVRTQKLEERIWRGRYQITNLITITEKEQHRRSTSVSPWRNKEERASAK